MNVTKSVCQNNNTEDIFVVVRSSPVHRSVTASGTALVSKRRYTVAVIIFLQYDELV
jgi:hypothetical protein